MRAWTGGAFSKLPGDVLLSSDSAETRWADGGDLAPRFRKGEMLDSFSVGNALRQRVGRLVPVENSATGDVRLQVRNARQTHRP
jgi:hypothetical protein